MSGSDEAGVLGQGVWDEIFGTHDPFNTESLRALIGRSSIVLDETAVKELIKGKRVLVTGGGGSIGSEICRQVIKHGPESLVFLDRDEGGLLRTDLSLGHNGLLDSGDTILADIRDLETIKRLFLEYKPDIVFHAAALKHFPLLQAFPAEALKTNVIGTFNVLTAAEAAGVKVFVNISTDKAAEPSSILGYSKRVAERITAAHSDRFTGACVSVRFGNVFGSRGAVITTFEKQISEGGPVTVTDRNVERFFMSIPEASQLVLQAAAYGNGGQTMVLNMGKPVRILDIAEQLIASSGREDIDIVFTGLRPFEKLTEQLFDAEETVEQVNGSDAIFAVRVKPLDFDLAAVAGLNDPAEAEQWLIEHGKTGETSND